MARVLKIFFHDGCFDGTTSAALFAAFYRGVIDRGAEVHPVGMIHKDGNPFEGVPLDADDHACVDFRFCADPKMRWWFDHHATAFQPPALRAVFEREHRPTWFFDPAAPSCAGLIAHSLETGWDWKPPPHLIEAARWADAIDAAQFASADEAVALSSPAQRMAAWLAHGRTPGDTARYVDWLSRDSLGAVANRPEIARELAAVEAERVRELDAIARLGTWHGDVIVFDRFDDLGARTPGFLGYLLFPSCLYAVAGTRHAQSIKISVGVNPWSTRRRRHDIGALCARFGGGGHAVVGGVTLRPDELPRARETMAALIRELETT
ncbi:MAG: phosphoesterase [Deltaproteobacteria bacterium]|nr:MAG: phosphoesterase [Deltaproteobacteria bacterium]